jgi:hypothetical protein
MGKGLRVIYNGNYIGERCLELENENSRLKKENLELLNYIYELLQDNRRLRLLILKRKPL